MCCAKPRNAVSARDGRTLRTDLEAGGPPRAIGVLQTMEKFPRAPSRVRPPLAGPLLITEVPEAATVGVRATADVR